MSLPEISIFIPTRGRPEKLRTCLDHLATQGLDPEKYEVLIGLDGPDSASEEEARSWETRLPCQVYPGERAGIAGVKNRLLRVARGEFLLFINDDIRPVPGFVEAHLHAHRSRSAPAMILGDSPWVSPENETQFDRLIARSSMIFFYDRMKQAGVDLENHDWGFRHAWNLNLSVPRAGVEEVGGFREGITNYGHEDVELAWRLNQTRPMPVLFRPDARADHEHRYTPDGYLKREHGLGIASFRFAVAQPQFAMDLHRRDWTNDRELTYAGEFIAQWSGHESEMLEVFRSLADRPADAWPGVDWIPLAYQHHLPLKRMHFYRGILEAAKSK